MIHSFVQFVQEGHYGQMKQLEQQQKEAKTLFKERLATEGKNRFEFERVGYVGKFIRKEIRTTDHKGLLEEIGDYVSKQHLISLNLLNFKPDEAVKELVSDFELPKEYYVRPTLNNAGKAFVRVQKGYYDSFPTILGIESEIPFYIERENEFSQLKKRYENVMQTIQLTKSVKTSIGTLSAVPKMQKYDLRELLKVYGEEMILSHSEVIMASLEEIVLAGIIPRALVKSHQMVTDIRVDFVMQSLESEQRAWEYQNKRKQELRQLLQV